MYLPHKDRFDEVVGEIEDWHELKKFKYVRQKVGINKTKNWLT